MDPMEVAYQITAIIALLYFSKGIYLFKGYVKGKKARLLVTLIMCIIGLYLLISTLIGVSTVGMFIFVLYSFIHVMLASYHTKWRHKEIMSLL